MTACATQDWSKVAECLLTQFLLPLYMRPTSGPFDLEGIPSAAQAIDRSIKLGVRESGPVKLIMWSSIKTVGMTVLARKTVAARTTRVAAEE